MASPMDRMRRDLDVSIDRLHEEYERLSDDAATLVSRGAQPERVWLCGCGDSLFAAQSLELWLSRRLQMPVAVCEALEYSRYWAPQSKKGELLLAISSSGEVARTREALQLAKRRGLRTVALTANADGRLAKLTAERLWMKLSGQPNAPGTTTFLNMLLGVTALGGALADHSGPDPKVWEALGGLSWVQALSESWARQVAETDPKGAIHFIGAGPNLAVARFAAAKFWELGQPAAFDELEEWAHGLYFTTRPGDLVVAVAPQGPSLGRAQEILSEVAFLKAQPALITTGVKGAIPERGVLALPLIEEDLSALFTYSAVSHLACSIARLEGRQVFSFPSQAHKEEHYRTILESALLTDGS